MAARIFICIIFTTFFASACFFQDAGYKNYIEEKFEYAITWNNTSLAKRCLAKGANVNSIGFHSIPFVTINPLIRAIEKKSWEVADLLIASGANIDAQNIFGDSALMMYSYAGSLQSAKNLIERGANVNLKNISGETAIDHAVKDSYNMHCSSELIELLLARGLKPGRGSLRLALSNTDEYLPVKALLKSFKEQGIKSGLSPFLEAVISGDTQNVKERIAKGADASEIEKTSGNTPVFYAAAFGYSGILETLVESGAKVNAPNVKNYTPLMVASEYGQMESVRYLVSEGAGINYSGYDTMTPLACAIRQERHDVAEYLIEKGADLRPYKFRAGEKGTWSFLIEAAVNGDAKMMDILFSHGYDAKNTDHQYTALFFSIRYGQKELLDYLVARGFRLDLLANPKEGDHPLFGTSIKGYYPIVKTLLDHGLNANITNKRGDTLLMKACEAACGEIVKLLLDSGANADALASSGGAASWNILQIALINNNSLEVIKDLVEHGANVNYRNMYMNGVSVLMTAAANGDEEIGKFILENGVEVNYQNEEGWTALMAAAANLNLEFIELLLSYGADKTLRKQNGESAYDLAKSRNFEPGMKALE